MRKPLLLTLFILGCCAFAKAQVQEIPAPPYIKSVIFKGDTFFGQLPIVELGTPISITFDDIYGDEANYYYKITHHNADWTESNLAQAEFMKGLDNVRIFDYENSVATLQLYTHYRLQIPNQNTKALTKTGNYIISFYNSDGDIVFSRKFMIYSPTLSVGVEIKRSRDLEKVNKEQRVQFYVDGGDFLLINPKQSVKTVIVKNNNLKNSIVGLKPQFTVGNKLIYRYDDASTFYGGNEFLNFENKDVRAANNGVQRIRAGQLYHNYLYIDPMRFNNEYTYNPDINGGFVISALQGVRLDIETEYVWIHFALDAPRVAANEEVHVYGNFNNFELGKETRLQWNDQQKRYELPILLKQGFYNYRYVITDKNQVPQDENRISGDFWQTENNYEVLVYYRRPGGRYDELLGAGKGNSRTITN